MGTDHHYSESGCHPNSVCVCLVNNIDPKVNKTNKNTSRNIRNNTSKLQLVQFLCTCVLIEGVGMHIEFDWMLFSLYLRAGKVG